MKKFLMSLLFIAGFFLPWYIAEHHCGDIVIFYGLVGGVMIWVATVELCRIAEKGGHN